MEHATLKTSALGLTLRPLPVQGAAADQLDFKALAFFMTANLLVTIGLFAVGIVIIGLFYERFRPWLLRNRKLRRERKRLARF
jgi:hypothetical protein